MKTIGEIIQELNLDTDKNTRHTYGPVYDELFKDFRDKEISLLEIGIWQGGSAALWNEFFKKGNFVFLDVENIVTEYNKSFLPHEKNTFIFGDAYGAHAIESIKDKRFDILIDDGPHFLDTYITFIENYLPLLKEDGILVIEDLLYTFDESQLPILLEKIPNNYEYEIIDRRDINPTVHDDNLLIVRHKK
jgi:cephalosporin hydroxylase